MPADEPSSSAPVAGNALPETVAWDSDEGLPQAIILSKRVALYHPWCTPGNLLPVTRDHVWCSVAYKARSLL